MSSRKSRSRTPKGRQSPPTNPNPDSPTVLETYNLEDQPFDIDDEINRSTSNYLAGKLPAQTAAERLSKSKRKTKKGSRSSDTEAMEVDPVVEAEPKTHCVKSELSETDRKRRSKSDSEAASPSAKIPREKSKDKKRQERVSAASVDTGGDDSTGSVSEHRVKSKRKSSDNRKTETDIKTPSGAERDEIIEVEVKDTSSIVPSISKNASTKPPPVKPPKPPSQVPNLFTDALKAKKGKYKDKLPSSTQTGNSSASPGSSTDPPPDNLQPLKPPPSKVTPEHQRLNPQIYKSESTPAPCRRCVRFFRENDRLLKENMEPSTKVEILELRLRQKEREAEVARNRQHSDPASIAGPPAKVKKAGVRITVSQSFMDPEGKPPVAKDTKRIFFEEIGAHLSDIKINSLVTTKRGNIIVDLAELAGTAKNIYLSKEKDVLSREDVAVFMEVMTDSLRKELKTYQELPVTRTRYFGLQKFLCSYLLALNKRRPVDMSRVTFTDYDGRRSLAELRNVSVTVFLKIFIFHFSYHFFHLSFFRLPTGSSFAKAIVKATKT